MSSYKLKSIRAAPYELGRVAGLCDHDLNKRDTFGMSTKQFNEYCDGYKDGIRMRKENMVNKMLEGDSNA